MKSLVLIIVLALAPLPLFAQQTSVIYSAHNLSAVSTAAVRASTEQEVCIFCHTPHHSAATVQPIWNRRFSTKAYTVYTSSSIQAVPGQPTGSSKLCLSCHDGTIALGSVISRTQPITMAGGITTIPPGAKNLGTDLHDDHPISFRYDTTLVGKNPALKSPSALPSAIKLDANRELQCTSCHDPHNNTLGKFLVMNNANSQLCKSCHIQGPTTVVNHQKCSSCHQPHSAPSGAWLLKGAKVRDTCLLCHSGATQPAPQGANIAAALTKVSIHDTKAPVSATHVFPDNLACSDCHEPHTMTTAASIAPTIPGRFGRINGVTTNGTATPTAQFEYEVCFKCHGDTPSVQPYITRRIAQASLRRKFDPTSISFHPVEARGKNTNVPSLKPGLSTASVIYCNDCHNSETAHKVGGAGPDGVHGSIYKPLLIAAYAADKTPENANTYALCYRCHNRNNIISESGPFPFHKKHIVDSRTACSVCHDPHGISAAQGTTAGNFALINFDSTIVTKDTKTGRLEFVHSGLSSGQCFLTCHGKAHSPLSYGAGAKSLTKTLSESNPPIAPFTPLTVPKRPKR